MLYNFGFSVVGISMGKQPILTFGFLLLSVFCLTEKRDKAPVSVGFHLPLIRWHIRKMVVTWQEI
jgi:hypothetical protein